MTITSPLPPTAPSAAAEEVRERVAAARSRGEALRLCGAGTWLDAGRPVRASTRLSLGELSGIVEYVPGDLTLTARAGTPLAELERVTAAERQWLPFDPFGSERGTLGATVATSSSGPLSHGFGAVRDNVLGIEVVTGLGEIIRGGGRVVKNVAGFDLVRLMIGAWGTLGVITEVSVRLRARPEVDRTVVLPLPSLPSEVERVLGAVRRASIAPLALQLVSAALAGRLGLEARDVILARLGGNEDAVRAQRAALAEIGDAVEAPAEVWRALRGAEPRDALVMRVAGRPTEIGERWCVVRSALGQGAAMHAWVGTGTIRVIAGSDDSAALDDLLYAVRRSPAQGRAIGERLTPQLWERLGTTADEPLSRRLREAFDPDFLLNPGILGETLP